MRHPTPDSYCTDDHCTCLKSHKLEGTLARGEVTGVKYLVWDSFYGSRRALRHRHNLLYPWMLLVTWSSSQVFLSVGLLRGLSMCVRAVLPVTGPVSLKGLGPWICCLLHSVPFIQDWPRGFAAFHPEQQSKRWRCQKKKKVNRYFSRIEILLIFFYISNIK